MLSFLESLCDAVLFGEGYIFCLVLAPRRTDILLLSYLVPDRNFIMEAEYLVAGDILGSTV